MQDALRLMDIPPDDLGELRSASLLPAPVYGRGIEAEGTAEIAAKIAMTGAHQ